MQQREMETQNKKKYCFAQAQYSLVKLCNIFDEAFFVDVSILLIIGFILKKHTFKLVIKPTLPYPTVPYVYL